MLLAVHNWFTNRRIIWVVIAAAGFSFIVPGIFGISPPQWLGHDKASDHLATNSAISGKADSGAVPENGNSLDQARHGLDQTPTTAYGTSSRLIDPVLVPRNFVNHIPASHLALSGAAQKESFRAIMLPLILLACEEIEARRQAILWAQDQDDRPSLDKWAKLYKLDTAKLPQDELVETLLRRAAPVPVALALAQAAVESGWGTSRFAVQGNAMFGQWAWRENAGIKPLLSTDKRAVVRSFDNLLGSVRAYMHNLNTHYGYTDFRATRAKIENQPEATKSLILVRYLDSYAEIGMAYVDKLRVIIKTNKFDTYALARLQ